MGCRAHAREHCRCPDFWWKKISSLLIGRAEPHLPWLRCEALRGAASLSLRDAVSNVRPCGKVPPRVPAEAVVNSSFSDFGE